MLIPSDRHRPDDLERWAYHERCDALECRSSLLNRRIDEASNGIKDFVSAGPCYVGVSWGKDSVVVAHIVVLEAPSVPLVWIRPDERENPDCVLVRDDFLRQYPAARYDEIVVPRSQADAGRGFLPAAQRYGDRYISGVRAEESSQRMVGICRRGLNTHRTCSPIGRWLGRQVFAYLYMHGLPVHPAYAMSQGGLWDRERIRVASIGGEFGTGHGRRAWEEYYYGRKFTQNP